MTVVSKIGAGTLHRQVAGFCVVPRRVSHVAGVVRVVKPTAWNSRESTSIPHLNSQSVPLTNHSEAPRERVERVSVDVRVSELFRKQREDPTNVTVCLSVIESLSLMGLDGTVLCKFPGFVSLMHDLSMAMNKNTLSSTELIETISSLHKIGIKNIPGSTEIDFVEFSTSISNQLVHLLESIPKPDLMRSIQRLEADMKIPLDEYFYWCLDKELKTWATNTSQPAHGYIKDVLGPLQVLTIPSIYKKTKVLSDSTIQSRMIDSLESMNQLLVIELVSNLQNTGDKENFFSVIQSGISRLLIPENRDRLEQDISDFSVVVSGLPEEALLRDSAVQVELEKILIGHAIPTESRLIVKYLNAVSDLVIGGRRSIEILEKTIPIIRDNITVLSQMKADRISNLFYMYSKASLENPEVFRSVCSDLEGFVVGRLPALSPRQLANLSLAFGSGIVNNGNSFKALGASIRRKAKSFNPIELTDALYGLAYGGLLVKSTLVESGINQVISAAPVTCLPKLSWSIAVADYGVPSTWDLLLNRLDNEVLTNPNVLDALIGQMDESNLYQGLVAAKVGQLGEISKSIERRLAQFDSSSAATVSTSSELDYGAILNEIGLKHSMDILPIRAKFGFLKIPVYIPEYRLILDLTKEPIVHIGSGVTGGSARLRHSLWSKLGYNVIAVSDSQFDSATSLTESASVLGTVINQFVSELSDIPVADTRSTGRERIKDLWSSRDDKPRRNITEEGTKGKANDAVWESRPATARRRQANNSDTLDSQWSSRE